MIDESKIPNSNLNEPNNALFEKKTKMPVLGPVSFISPFELSSELKKCLDVNTLMPADEFEMNFTIPETKLTTFVTANQKLRILPQQVDFPPPFPLQPNEDEKSLKQSIIGEPNMIIDTQNDIQNSKNSVFQGDTSNIALKQEPVSHNSSNDIQECLDLNVAETEHRFELDFSFPTVKLNTFVTALSKITMLPEKLDFSTSLLSDTEADSLVHSTLEKQYTACEEQKQIKEYVGDSNDARLEISTKYLMQKTLPSEEELKVDFDMPTPQLNALAFDFSNLKTLPDQPYLEISFPSEPYSNPLSDEQQHLQEPNHEVIDAQCDINTKNQIQEHQSSFEEFETDFSTPLSNLDDIVTALSKPKMYESKDDELNNNMFDMEIQNQVQEGEFEMNFSTPSIKLDSFLIPFCKLKTYSEKLDFITPFPVQSDTFKQADNLCADQKDIELNIDENISKDYDTLQDLIDAEKIAPQSEIYPSSRILSGLIKNKFLGPQSIRNFFVDPSPKNIDLITQYNIKSKPRNLNTDSLNSSAFPTCTCIESCMKLPTDFNKLITFPTSLYEESNNCDSQSGVPLFFTMTMGINSLAEKIISHLNTPKDESKYHNKLNILNQTDDMDLSTLPVRNAVFSEVTDAIQYREST